MVQSRIKNAFCPQAGLWILDTADPEVNDYNNCDKGLTTYRKNTLSEHVCVCVYMSCKRGKDKMIHKQVEMEPPKAMKAGRQG